MSLRETALNTLTGGAYGRQRDALQAMQEHVRANNQAFRRLAESYQSFALERAKEDAEWTLLASGNEAQGGLARKQKVEWARRAFRTDPFAKRAVLAKGDFCFGSGIDGPRRRANVTGEAGEETATDPGVQVLLDFWNDTSNQALMFSAPMQAKRSGQLLTDGDLFLLITARPGQTTQVRRFGSLLVDHIVNDPDDADRPLYYAVRDTQATWSADAGAFQNAPGTRKWKFYRDIHNTDPATDPLADTVEAEPDVYMMHVAINTVEDGGFGESDLITSLEWLNAAKMIAEDQATVSKATASLMAVLEATTNDETALAGLQSSLQSQTDGGPDAPLAGGVNVMSEGLSLSVNRAGTQASDAWQNSRMMRLPAVIGFGFAMHYLGDPENANLATSKSMELPILKMLEAYQTLWLSVYGTLFEFVLRFAGFDPADVPYEIPVPKIIEPEIAEVADAIFAGEERGLITFVQAAQRLMDLLGFDDIPARLEELMADKGAREQADEARMKDLLDAQDAAPKPEPGDVSATDDQADPDADAA